MQSTITPKVTLDARGITIDGRRRIVICGSLFYFRIPEGSWEDRMKKIRLAGYNCIDVYFPWNFHETEKDHWDFSSGMKDVDRFLSFAEKHELYVMARPGPYICSEWDGGSLPAYLFAEGIDIRQNDAAYLARVEEWYARVVPIIVAHQIDLGGSVILLQVENELDFFSCNDVPGYIGALARSARAHGITVPVFACAGQGDLYGAWGKINDVVPAMNLYIDSKMPGIEEGITIHTKMLADFDTPLMVAEMGRDNLLMRRYLASGAKLLGPYNQVAGFDFGFTEGVNNWGDPVSFQTSYYDFLSLITPYGEIRDFIAEDRVLSKFLGVMGELIAGSFPADFSLQGDTGFIITKSDGTQEVPPVLDLGSQDDAYAVAINNLSEQQTDFQTEGRGVSETITLPPFTSAFMLVNVDMEAWGIPAILRFSTAEPVYLKPEGDPVLVWQAPVSGCMELIADGSMVRFEFDAATQSSQSVFLPDGRTFTLIGIGRAAAARISGVSGSDLELLENDYAASVKEGIRKDFSFAASDTNNTELFAAGAPHTPEQGHFELEKNGAPRGYGLYSFTGNLRDPGGVVLHDAADIVSLYCGSTFIATRFPAGTHQLIPFPKGSVSGQNGYQIRAEIWGHSNFDDSRKPSLRIQSLRGISGFTEVREIRPLPLWRTVSPAEGDIPYYRVFGGHLTTDRPAHSTWFYTLDIPRMDNSVLLSFDGIQCDAEIVVNGQPAGQADAFTGLVDISEHIRPGKVAEIRVNLSKRHYDEAAGIVSALFGSRIQTVTLSTAAEEALLKDAESKRPGATPITLPLELEPGRAKWLFCSESKPGRFDDQKVEMNGKNCKASVFFNGILCGRLFLPTEGGPKMVWKANWGYLPGCWSSDTENSISVFVEAVGKEPALLESIEISPISSS